MRRHWIALAVLAMLVAGCSAQRRDDGAPVTTPAAPATAARSGGQPFVQPQELRSADGVLRVTLTAEEREVTIAGVTVRGRVFTGRSSPRRSASVPGTGSRSPWSTSWPR